MKIILKIYVYTIIHKRYNNQNLMAFDVVAYLNNFKKNICFGMLLKIKDITQSYMEISHYTKKI